MSPERFARINEMLDNRQPDLTICLDKVHKTNNIAAVIRTADAVGIHQIHAVWPDIEMRVSGNTASGSQQWVNTIKHYHMDDAQQEFYAQGMQILATTFSETAVDFRDIDYTRPTAIILGNEQTAKESRRKYIIENPSVRMIIAELIPYHHHKMHKQVDFYPRPL